MMNELYINSVNIMTKTLNANYCLRFYNYCIV